MSDTVQLHLVHDEEKDMEARSYDKNVHMAHHNRNLKQALRLRPGLDALPELGGEITVYWTREAGKKRKYVGLFCSKCAAVFEAPHREWYEEYAHVCEPIIDARIDFVPATNADVSPTIADTGRNISLFSQNKNENLM